MDLRNAFLNRRSEVQFETELIWWDSVRITLWNSMERFWKVGQHKPLSTPNYFTPGPRLPPVATERRR